MNVNKAETYCFSNDPVDAVITVPNLVLGHSRVRSNSPQLNITDYGQVTKVDLVVAIIRSIMTAADPSYRQVRASIYSQSPHPSCCTIPYENILTKMIRRCPD